MPELSDKQLDELLDAIDSMPTPSFYPPQAREAGDPFIERHRIAFDEIVFTVWHADVPIAVNLDANYKAADQYLDHLDKVGLAYPPPSSSQSNATD